jgi:hypothetical protein
MSTDTDTIPPPAPLTRELTQSAGQIDEKMQDPVTEKPRKRKKRKRRDPDAPKRPLNRWFLFLQEWRKTNVINGGRYAKMSVIEQAKKAREEYK